MIIVILALALMIPASAKVNFDKVGASLVTSQSEVSIDPGDKLYIIGWAYCDAEVSQLKEMFYTVDGKETVLAGPYRDRLDVFNAFAGKVANNGDHAGFGLDAELMELTGIDALADGTYEVKICARFENGKEEVGHTFTLVVGDGGGAQIPTKEYVGAAGTNSPIDGKAIWMNNAGEYAAAEFTATGSFKSIKLSTFWASEMSKNVPVTYTLDLFKFVNNAEETLATKPVATTTIVAVTNGNPPAVLNFAEDMPAGTYIFKVSVGGEFLNGTNDGSYMVLDHAATEEVENVKYFVNAKQAGNKTFGFSVVANTVEGNFFAANPADTTGGQQGGQEENAKTGDATVAMFAAIAVLAIGAAVVFMKKKAF